MKFPMETIESPPKPSHSVAIASPLGENEEARDQPEVWRLFTPAKINMTKCLARTWGNGAGGQCNHNRDARSVFCSKHKPKNAWQTHGRVDGPIPEKKLEEFLKVSEAKARESKPTPAKRKAAESMTTPAKKRAAESTTTPTKESAASADVLPAPEASKLKKPTGGAFAVYRSQNMQAIKASLLSKREESTLSSIAREAALLWKELSVDKKTEYENAYDTKKRAYKAAQGSDGSGKKRKAERTVLTKPDGTPFKRPLTSFGLFIKERRESIKASLPADHKVVEVTKKAGVLWKALPEEERTTFRERSSAEMSSYQQAAHAARKAEAAAKGVLLVQRPKILRRRRKKAW